MTKLCRQYIYQVKLLLPTVGKAEKKYLATLANNLEDFVKILLLKQSMTCTKTSAHL